MSTFWIVFAAVGWTLSVVFLVLVFVGAKRIRLLTNRSRYWRKRAYEQPDNTPTPPRRDPDGIEVGGLTEEQFCSLIANTLDLADADRDRLDDDFLQIMNGGWPATDSEENQ